MLKKYENTVRGSLRTRVNDPSALPFREQLADYVFCSPARSVIWKGKGRPLYQKGRSLNVGEKNLLCDPSIHYTVLYVYTYIPHHSLANATPGSYCRTKKNAIL